MKLNFTISIVFTTFKGEGLTNTLEVFDSLLLFKNR